MLKLAAVSVDLDEIDNYAAIHGLDGAGSANDERIALSKSALRAVYQRALPRLAALFRELDVPCTFFAVGRDLVHADNAAALCALASQGHEIANHSLSHLYDLTRRARAEQVHEVRGGADAIEAAVGVRPRGFRAPGYTLTDTLASVVAAEGAQYDSSVFPCPAYYAAKTAAIGLIRARGRVSHSIVDDPRVLAVSADPYRMGDRYRTRGRGLLELPIGVTSSVSGRLPFIGTSVVLAGARGARWLAARTAGRPLVNLELHGIDLADAEADGLRDLSPHQPDLRRTLASKRAALSAAISELKDRGYSFVTLDEAARRLPV